MPLVPCFTRSRTRRVARLPRLTRVQTMSLDKINGQEGSMEAKVTLSIFFEPETGTNTTASAR